MVRINIRVYAGGTLRVNKHRSHNEPTKSPKLFKKHLHEKIPWQSPYR